MKGKFKVSGSGNVTLVMFGPRDLTEARDGVPQVAFAITDHVHQMQNHKIDLARFLNDCLKIYAGGPIPDYFKKKEETQ